MHFLSKTNVRFGKNMLLKKLVFKKRTWENAVYLENQCTSRKNMICKREKMHWKKKISSKSKQRKV